MKCAKKRRVSKSNFREISKTCQEIIKVILEIRNKSGESQSNLKNLNFEQKFLQTLIHDFPVQYSQYYQIYEKITFIACHKRSYLTSFILSSYYLYPIYIHYTTYLTCYCRAVIQAKILLIIVFFFISFTFNTKIFNVMNLSQLLQC